MRRLNTPLLLLVAAIASLGSWSVLPATASARKQTDYRYHYEQVWSAAVRMVRVDLRYRIEDQNADVGYVLFRYDDRGQEHHGSIELVRTRVEGRTFVRTVVQIPSMPSYIEQMLLDRLERKLRAEFGEPPERPRTPPRGDRGRGDRGDEGDDDRGRGGDRDREGDDDRGRDRDRSGDRDGDRNRDGDDQRGRR